MKGADEQGVAVVKGDAKGRFDKFSPSIDELTGLGEESDRDGAIIALSLKCKWSPSRLATLFGISEKRVYAIVGAFKAEYEDSL